jgi:hypothetical protein
MSGQIFISYRREESRWSARSLHDRLTQRFDRNQIFMDVDSLRLGEDFVKKIEESVGSCDVLIAVIGAHWLISTDEQGGRRLDNPEDFVRMEIATALRRHIRVIPVLTDGASMPRSTDLPDDLKQLARRQALQVGDTHFDDDCRRLVAAIELVLEKAAAEHSEREEEERWEHSSGGTGGKSPSKQLIAFLAAAAILVVGGLVYLTPHKAPPAQSASVAAATPSPSVIATPIVKESAPTTSEIAGQAYVQPTAPPHFRAPQSSNETTEKTDKRGSDYQSDAPTTPHSTSTSSGHYEATVSDPDGWTYLRGGPSTSFPPKGKVRTAETVVILGRAGNWYQVQTQQGLTGYMYGDRLYDEVRGEYLVPRK